MSYYAVSCGHQPGIYRYWNECHQQVSGYSGAEYRKFQCYADAWHFMERRGYDADDEIDNCGEHSEDEEDEYNDFYAVSVGHIPGIYTSSSDSMRQTTGYSYNESRKFHCRKDAEHFMQRRKILYYCNGPNNPSRNMKFHFDEEAKIKIHVAADCSRSGAHNARAGYGIWFTDNHELNFSSSMKVDGLTLYNAEAHAVSTACKMIKSIHMDKVVIYMDSTYIIDCVLSLINGWASNKWQTKSGRDIGNKIYLKELYAAWKGLDVSFVLIENKHNKAADLARRAVEES